VDVPIASGNGWGNDGFGFFFQRYPEPQTGNLRPRGGPVFQNQPPRYDDPSKFGGG
jgi:hypothetical protein